MWLVLPRNHDIRSFSVFTSPRWLLFLVVLCICYWFVFLLLHQTRLTTQKIVSLQRLFFNWARQQCCFINTLDSKSIYCTSLHCEVVEGDRWHGPLDFSVQAKEKRHTHTHTHRGFGSVFLSLCPRWRHMCPRCRVLFQTQLIQSPPEVSHITYTPSEDLGKSSLIHISHFSWFP